MIIKSSLNRRHFIKTVSAAGVGSMLAVNLTNADTNEPNKPDPNKAEKEQKPKFPQVPRKKLGKTDIEIPVLCLGMMFNVTENQIMLIKSMQHGVNYWDTAKNYTGGNSELGIGKFLARNPKLRKKVLIATKASGAKTPDDIEKCLQQSLRRMNTDYIDVYYGIHAMEEPEQLTEGLKKWAESAKKRKLIRAFGITTHTNMENCMLACAQRDWIDVVMTRYNFRLMQKSKMKAAVDACSKAKIGLIAMKTQAHGQFNENEKELSQKFLKRGFTVGQAKIKIVLSEKKITSACVGRGNIEHLMQNIAAVLDKTKLADADKNILYEYARENAPGYCQGCAEICQNAAPEMPCVGDVMRYLMYHNNYGEKQYAKQLFSKLPASIRKKLPTTDYTAAEAACPNNMPIAALMKEAASVLA